MIVSLHIEELVLHGFAAGDRHAIAQGLRSELERLLTEQGVPRSMALGTDLPRIDGISFDMAPTPRPQALGARIARSVFGGMSE